MFSLRQSVAPLTTAAILAAVVLTAAPADALTPEQVLVVANSDSSDSRSLAQDYVQARHIPKENLLLLKVSDAFEIRRDDYEKQVRAPIRQYLSQSKLQDRIRCICLVYGMPVRIAPTELAASAKELFKVYASAADRSASRLARDYRWSDEIGRTFPATEPDRLDPPDKLFEPLPDSPIPPSNFAKLQGKTLALLAQKQDEIAAIKDPVKRRLAWRQLMAIQRDIGGLKAMIACVESAKPAGAPDLAALRDELAKQEKQYADLQSQPQDAKTAAAELELAQDMMGLAQVHAVAQSKAKLLGPAGTDAAVDSELALLWWKEYSLGGWTPNALHWQAAHPTGEAMPTLMASRLDGPSADDVLADDSRLRRGRAARAQRHVLHRRGRDPDGLRSAAGVAA